MKYFTIKELCASATANEKHINNTPTKEAEYNLIKLVDAVLDPLREAYGKPITVSSGYRCRALNNAIPNASKTSQHLTGQAADICIKNADGSVNTKETRVLYDLIIQKRLPFDQIILEKGTQMNPLWVHVSYDEKRSRREKLYWNGKNYISIK